MRATEFTDGISGDWGGKPFIDLLNGWKYALNQHPEVKVYRRLFCSQLDDVFLQIDPERAVAAGASWGGYAIKYVQRWLS